MKAIGFYRFVCSLLRMEQKKLKTKKKKRNRKMRVKEKKTQSGSEGCRDQEKYGGKKGVRGLW